MKINFIPDEVLKLTSENDLLGTKPYADTLFEIINNCQGKKNIGLFGTWGSGKSTVLKTLDGLIENHNNTKINGKKLNLDSQIGYFEFDAWKYSNDDFRRSFLIELKKTFDLKGKNELKKLLYSEASFEDPEKTTFKLNLLSLPNWLTLLIVLLAFIFYFLPILQDNKDLKGFISLFTITISLLSTAASNTINRYKVVVKENKIVEPERFEEVFDEIILELTKSFSPKPIIFKWIQSFFVKEKFEKVVIVIDNLDRCDDENLLITLNTIKNFLEHEKVIFILPVDENGISSFLSQKTDNADEYLRKIFHLIIRLKGFSNNELLEFTNKVNEAYNLGLNSTSIRILCQEFTNNPRKIIQFLNNYQSEMKLVDEQSKIGYVNGSYINENLSFFIKLLIIKYEWKPLYDEILYDKNLLSKINNVITNLEPGKDGLYSINRTNVKLTDAQRNFFFKTQEIHCSKVDPFVLNIDFDKDIPDEIEELIKNGVYKEIINFLDNKEIDFDENKLLQKINEVYSNLTFKHREYEFIALPILKLLIEFILDDNQKEFKTILNKNHKEYPFLKSLFKNPKINILFDKFDFEKLTKTTKWLSENVNDDLLNSFVAYLNTTIFKAGTTVEDEKQKIEFFISTFKNSDKLNLIKTELSNKLNSNTELLKMDVLKDYQVASKIITSTTYKTLSRKLNISDLKEESARYDIATICLSYSENNPTDLQTKKELLKYYLNDLEIFYKNEKITQNVYINYEDYFKTVSQLLSQKIDIKLSTSFIEVLYALNDHFYVKYDINFKDEELYDVYEAFFEFIQALIFNTKDFNTINLRTKYFGDYLAKDFSDKISTKIINLLYKDVEKHEVYDYPFSEILIKQYLEPKKSNPIYPKILIKMLDKSQSREAGLKEDSIDKIILRTINLFTIHKNKEYITYMKVLKKNEGEKFLKILNEGTGIFTSRYVKAVKLLKDDWFYGDSVVNYLNSNLISKKGSYSSFKGNLGDIVEIFSTDEQLDFIKKLIDTSNDKVYKWLRLSYRILPKKVFDLYLSELVIAYSNKKIGHNDFLEWILEIPKSEFYKKRLDEYIKFLNDLNITHKTYSPKKDKALEHLNQ